MAFAVSKAFAPGSCDTKQRHRGFAEEETVGRVVESAQFYPRDVPQPDGPSALASLHDDVFELPGVLQAAREDQVRLKGPVGYGWLPKLPARYLQVLRAYGGQDIAGRHVQVGEPVRIQPDPHRIVAGAEDGYVADTLDPEKLVTDLTQAVVRDVELVVGLVRRLQEDDQKKIGAVLFRRDAEPLHFVRKTRLRDRDPVLDQYLGLVQIGAELEGDGDRQLSGGGGLAVDVQHVLDAVHLLLDRRSDRVGDHLRRRTRVLRRDHDRRRHDLGVLRNRQRGISDGADDHEQDRHHHRQDRLVDGKAAQIHILGVCSGRRRLVRQHLCARLRALKAVHDDPIVRRDARAHDPNPCQEAPGRRAWLRPYRPCSR